MSNTRVVVYQRAPSYAFIIFCIFLVLKLTHTIAWSWWLVTLPIWIGFATVVGFLLAGGIIASLIATLIAVVSHFQGKLHRRRLRKRIAERAATRRY